MKKIFTLILFAMGLSLAASAQNWNGRYNNQDGYQVNQPAGNGYYGQRQQSSNYGYNDRGYGNHGYYDRRQPNEDYRSQPAYGQTNQEYDQRNYGYGNGRSFSRYDRNGRIPERQQNAKAFGTGIVVGGLAVALLGALFAHGQ